MAHQSEYPSDRGPSANVRPGRDGWDGMPTTEAQEQGVADPSRLANPVSTVKRVDQARLDLGYGTRSTGVAQDEGRKEGM